MIDRSFGVGNVPYLDIDNHGVVNIDASFHIHLAEAKGFQSSVTPQTWSLVQNYVADLKQRNIRIAIFGTTTQGNANANATRSLVRLSHSLGIDMRW